MVSYHTALGMYQKPPSTGSATSSPGGGSAYHQPGAGPLNQHHMIPAGHHMPSHHHHSPPSPWFHHPTYGSTSNQQFYHHNHQAQYLSNCLHENSANDQQNFTNLYHNLYQQQQQPQNWGSDFHFADQQNLAGVVGNPITGSNIVPSPPITVSGGSEISSPGGGTNGGDQEDKPGAGNRLEVPGGTGRSAVVRSPYEWMKKPSYQSQPNPGKTRTKDKYRVVYTDHQRMELEKEFQYTRYISIRRKTEIAAVLALSERQVKIWFQNRRAKERKVKKRENGSSCATNANNNRVLGLDSNPMHHHHHQYLHQQMALHHSAANPSGFPVNPYFPTQISPVGSSPPGLGLGLPGNAAPPNVGSQEAPVERDQVPMKTEQMME